jgi:hypothetical protein
VDEVSIIKALAPVNVAVDAVGKVTLPETDIVLVNVIVLA